MPIKKIKPIQREIKQYSDKCPICNYEVIGTSEGQVKYNLKVHAMQKHNIQIDLKEDKQNGDRNTRDRNK